MRVVAFVRWIARIWGAASILLLLAFAFGGGEHLRFRTVEAVAFLFFPIGVIIGLAVAWWRELAGGLIAAASLAAFYLYALAVNERWVGPYFLLFAAPGFLHLAIALIAGRSRRHESLSPSTRSGGV